MRAREYLSVTHIVSLVCLALGFVSLWDFTSTEGLWGIMDLLSAVALIFGGLVISLMRRPDVYTAAGVLGISLGLSITFRFSIYFTSTKLIVFLLGCTVVLCGVLSVAFAISLYCGKKYNVQRMKVIYLVYMGITVLPLILNVAIFNIDLFKAMVDLKVCLLSFIIVLGYFIILNDPEIRYTTASGRMANNINAIGNILFNDPNAYISRDDILAVTDVKDWTPVNEGPIVSESILPLTIGGKPAMLISHLWEDGRYFGEIVRSNRGTVIQSLRFEYTDIVIENDDPRTCPDVTIYGKDGFFIRLLVNDQESKLKRMSKGVRILYRIMGYRGVVRGHPTALLFPSSLYHCARVPRQV